MYEYIDQIHKESRELVYSHIQYDDLHGKDHVYGVLP
jgi:hypothetical protein